MRGVKDVRFRPGGVMVGEFELDGQPVMILNGGPHIQLSEAFSLSIEFGMLRDKKTALCEPQSAVSSIC